MTKWPIKWELRTSENYPLHIDWISHVNFKGKIGLTLCPDKYQPVSWTGGWNRELNTDLDVIYRQDVSTIISLIENEEMEKLRVENIGELIVKKGMRWIHLPIEDTAAPNDTWVSEFMLVLDSLVDEIMEGKFVVIHCKGGLGRAGTCAALLLYALGLNMDWAIDLVRMRRSKDCINIDQYTFLEFFEITVKKGGFILNRNTNAEVTQ